MARNRAGAWIVLGIAASVLASGLPLTAQAAAGAVPLSTVVPFALPLLEGAQVKVELGVGGPHGDATSYWGNQPAFVNFSVWWWDTGPPTSARLILDGLPYGMTPAPVGDGDDTNGTLYLTEINLTGLAAGDHNWYFEFASASVTARLPLLADGNFTNLRLDTADRFLSDALRNTATSIVNARRAGSLATLRDVVDRALIILNPQMGTNWDPANGYNYTDPNHYIIQPAGATSENKEAFIAPSGASRVRYADMSTFINNSQTAIKQALVLQGVLLATGFFNASDIQIVTEPITINTTLYPHPFLRIALHDLSEVAGDGPVDGDNSMDADIWGAGLSTAVPTGSHFGEDFDGSNDAAWDGSHGWPPVADPYSAYVLSQYAGSWSVAAPDGSSLDYFLFDSHPFADITTPRPANSYWTDEPVVFDGLSSYQSAGVDLFYDWHVENSAWAGLGPIWLQPIQAVGDYTVTLNVCDAFVQCDSVPVRFSMHGKTKLLRPVGDRTFQEDTQDRLDLRSVFADDDGYNTIQFSFSANPAASIFLTRTSNASSLLTISAAPHWCGVGDGYINATDNLSPVVVEHFAITVTCVENEPVITGLPTAVNFTEDGMFRLPRLSSYGSDPDVGDVLTWSCGATTVVTCTVSQADDWLQITAPADWHYTDSATVSLSDGSVTVNQTIVITVFAQNDPPYRSAPIADFVVPEDSGNTTFVLTDYFTDPDGETPTAQATAGPGIVAGYFPVVGYVWFHPIANFSGATYFDLRVRDPSDAAITVRVNVTVVEVNDPPFIVTTDPDSYERGEEGQRLTFLVSAIDSDSTTLTYSFSLDGDPQGSSFLGSFEWQTGYLSAGSHTLEVAVTDGAGGSASYRWSVLISDRNRGPTVTIVGSGPFSFKTGQPFQLTADGLDPDGDDLTYTWTFGGALQPLVGREINLTLTSEGNLTAKVTVSDGKLTASDTVLVAITYVPPIEPPNNGTPTTPTTTQKGFLPGFGGPAAVLGLAAAAVVFASIARRRR